MCVVTSAIYQNGLTASLTRLRTLTCIECAIDDKLYRTVILRFSLLSHPFSLLLLHGLLSCWAFLYLFRPSDQPLTLFGRTFSNRETLGILILLSVLAVFLTSVGSVIVSAPMVGAALVCSHGAFRVPEDMFLDEQDPAATGFLSFLGGAASNVAALVAIVAARV